MEECSTISVWITTISLTILCSTVARSCQCCYKKYLLSSFKFKVLPNLIFLHSYISCFLFTLFDLPKRRDLIWFYKLYFWLNWKRSSALLLHKVSPQLPMSAKFDLVMGYFNKMAAGEKIGFNNSVFLSERDTADRNFALAYFMKENKCFPEGFNLQETLDFYFQVVKNQYLIRVIFLKDHIPIRPDRNLLLGRQTSKCSLCDVIFH